MANISSNVNQGGKSLNLTVSFLILRGAYSTIESNASVCRDTISFLFSSLKSFEEFHFKQTSSDTGTEMKWK